MIRDCVHGPSSHRFPDGDDLFASLVVRCAVSVVSASADACLKSTIVLIASINTDILSMSQ